MKPIQMNRRTLLQLSVQLGAAGAVGAASTAQAATEVQPSLAPPAKGRIPVAFLLSKGAVVIDFAGPWEVFQDVRDLSRGDAVTEVAAFQPYIVAATMAPIVASGGLTIVPNFTFESAPIPKVIVIPAQSGTTEADLEWLRTVSKTADMTLSVCTGAFILARSGLLDGKTATTHHSSFDAFAKLFPKIKLERDVRYIDHGNVATSAGLSAGIDLALHVVQRYFGPLTARQTARQLEYQSKSWVDGAAIEKEQHNHSEHNDRPSGQNGNKANGTGYVCPPCGCAADGRLFSSPGACPACGMQLIKKA